MPEAIVMEDYYTSELCLANRDKLFVFGDNLIGIGKGGQAIIRDEPNVFGIPTKIYPLEGDHVYMRDPAQGYEMAIMKQFFDMQFHLLTVIAEDYGFSTIVFPAGGLGTGLSRMPEFAPELLEYIDSKVSEMIGSDYREWRNENEQATGSKTE